MKFGARKTLFLLINIASWSYLVLLIGWILLHFLTGDQIPYLALANFLIVYLFIPLPLVLLAALVARSRSLGTGFAIGAVTFLLLWGPQFTPRLQRPHAEGLTLTIMTYNVLAWHTYTQPVIETIRAQYVDVVCFQELNHTLAEAVSTELKEEFPYQILEPVDSPSGIGVISRFPIHRTGERLPLLWVGGPQVLELEWNGQSVTLVNIHMVPNTRLATTPVIDPPIRLREAQARELVALARRSSPIIIAGDANSAPLNEATRIITRELRDSWREAGFGLGHTFPGSTIPGSDRPRIGNNRYVPPWLARIDYVFHSKEWVTVSAKLAPFDRVSDHRGVIAVLKLKK
ncbi:MAG TPA: endonuclease/exonuclease/phosphatase family protein [Anaerolineales bacterium]